MHSGTIKAYYLFRFADLIYFCEEKPLKVSIEGFDMQTFEFIKE